MAGVNLTAMWRGRQQHCQFVHSVASLITFLPHHILSCLMWYILLCCYTHLLRPQLRVISACPEPIVSCSFWYMPSDWHHECMWLIVLFNNACFCINHGKCGCIWKSLEKMLLRSFSGCSRGAMDMLVCWTRITFQNVLPEEKADLL